jgi:flagellar protein FlaH
MYERDSEHQQKRIVSTGNAEIDKKMGGGIPLGSLTLIEGQSDAGKSVLAQQLIWGALQNDYRVVLYTSENTSRSLLRQMNSLSLDVTDDFLLKRLRVYTIPATAQAAGEAVSDLEIVLQHLACVIPCDLVIIDSLTGLIVNLPDLELFSFFSRCKTYCDQGTTVAIIVHSYVFNESMLTRIRSLCDAHLHLRITEIGDQMVKMLEVAKIRGADKTTGNIISFTIEPGLGMRIIPISRARA